jgi:hypothetical protein
MFHCRAGSAPNEEATMRTCLLTVISVGLLALGAGCGGGGGGGGSAIDPGTLLEMPPDSPSTVVGLLEEDLATLEAVMRAGIAEFLTPELWQETVAKVYVENFTAAELQATREFYLSPAGQRILRLQRSLDDQIGDAVETVLEVHSDEFAGRIDAALAERFPEFAEGGS